VATFRTIPAVSVEVVPPEVEREAIRSDVLGIALVTRRGPLGERVRLEGWRDAERVLGGLARGSDATFALRGYFENGGELAIAVRLAGAHTALAWVEWDVGAVAARGRFRSTRYRIEASSPGAWANGCALQIRFATVGAAGAEQARVTMTVECPGEPLEVLANLDPANLEDEVAASSLVVRVRAIGPAPDPAHAGPRHARYPRLELGHGADAAPGLADYQRALQLLDDEPLVALIALPGLIDDLGPGAGRAVLEDAIAQAAAAHDRMVLVDPPDDDAGIAMLGAITGLGNVAGDAVTYLPRVRVGDPFASVGPLRTIASSGHVAGLISRHDRERGAHRTPAGEALAGVFDLREEPDDDRRRVLLTARANLLLCHAGHGVVVWGGRTLAQDTDHPTRTHVAHRRFVHRLVRVMRRVAEPLVFETNGPETWLALVRALTTVLREAWRAGALRGSRPEEAFQVTCDETTQTADDIANGRCICEVRVALAAPMEFIVLRIALRRDGTLEVA
jgi:uncharacterized protein